MDQKIKVVVVDDEPYLQALIKINLEMAGAFEVFGVEDVFAVEQACREKQPDVVLLDYRMPKRSGTEVLLAMKADPGIAGIPVVMMSGFSESLSDSLMAECSRDMNGFIEKPFQVEQLIATITQALKGKAA